MAPNSLLLLLACDGQWRSARTKGKIDERVLTRARDLRSTTATTVRVDCIFFVGMGDKRRVLVCFLLDGG